MKEALTDSEAEQGRAGIQSAVQCTEQCSSRGGQRRDAEPFRDTKVIVRTE